MRYTPLTAPPFSEGSAEHPFYDAERATLLSVGLPLDIAIHFAYPRKLVQSQWPDLSILGQDGQNVDVVACPLIAPKGDSLQVLEALREKGFTGTLLVVAPKLPNPGMVLSELRGLAPPELTVTLVSP